MRLAFDMSSVMNTAIKAKIDPEGFQVEHNGKMVQINTAAYGYEHAINLMVLALEETGCVPSDCILVFEGKDSKRRRVMIDPTYKANRGKGPPEEYIQFNSLKDMMKDTWRKLGAICVSQDGVEGDDVLGWLAKHVEEDLTIVTNDGDMSVLNGVNEHGANILVRLNKVTGLNKYGDFDFKLITLYKALVGDSNDGIKGVVGFGDAAWLDLNFKYGDDGCFELMALIGAGKRDEVAQIAHDNKCKLLTKITDQWDAATKCLKLTKLHPEWVNTVRSQLVWEPGMVQGDVMDERLKKWRAQKLIVTASNYERELAFFKSKMSSTPYVTLDYETTNPPESDDWLELIGKKVDPIGSTIVSCGMNFGRNLQYSIYITINHKDSDNITLEQFVEFIKAIPQGKHIIAHNAEGFELPVGKINFGHLLDGNGWRGFLPNIVDTRIAASYWDENAPSHGLKQLSSSLLNYEQTSYDEVTTLIIPGDPVAQADGTYVPGPVTKVQRKMHELTVEEAFDYGVDDVMTTGALWGFFRLFMQLEHSYNAFFEYEQLPPYLTASAYVRGVDVNMPRLKELERADKKLYEESWEVISKYLITKGWDGTVCPVFTTLDAPSIKQAVAIVTGEEFKTMVRTPSKLVPLIEQLDSEHSELLARLVSENKLDLMNELVARHFKGAPIFNVGSFVQIGKLMYDVMELPIRLRNKPTDAMKAAGKREGNPRTDDGAINTAIGAGDAKDEKAVVLKALLNMKSCNTRNSLYWTAYPKLLHWKTGRLHPELRQSATNTRRFTAGNPNIQQQESSADGVRSTIGLNGYMVASLDESAQEVRMLADLTQDAGLLSCYIGDSPRDAHSIVGSYIQKITYEEFRARLKTPETKEEYTAYRQYGKITLFSLIYGAGAGKVAETLGITEELAQKYIDAIFVVFPGIKAYQEASSNMAKTDGYVPIPGGTRRHLAKLITSEDNYEAAKAERQAGNARIQSGCGNQMKRIMARIWQSRLLDDFDYQWLFPVHDESVHAMKPEEAPEILPILHGFMVEQFLVSVPSESSIGLGKNYGQLTEIESKAYPAERVAEVLKELEAA